MKKILLIGAVLLVVFSSCFRKNGNVNSPDAVITPQNDTISYTSDTLREVKQYDAKSKTVKTVTFKKPNCEIESHIHTLGI